MSKEEVVQEEKKMLSAQEILDAEDIVETVVYVPEWKGSVRLRSMTAAEAEAFVREVEVAKDKHGAARVLAWSAVDDEGNKLFTAEDIEKLRAKSFGAIVRLQKEALRINGMEDEAAKIAKNV